MCVCVCERDFIYILSFGCAGSSLLCCARAFSGCGSGGSSLVTALGFLIAVASLVGGEHRL